MSRLVPVSRAKLVRRLKDIGFEGPFPGSDHDYMIRGDNFVRIPNSHRRERRKSHRRDSSRGTYLVMSGSPQIRYPFCSAANCGGHGLDNYMLCHTININGNTDNWRRVSPPSPGPQSRKPTRGTAPMREHARARLRADLPETTRRTEPTRKPRIPIA